MTDTRTGLSTADIDRLREQSGFNEITEKTTHPLRKLLGYFWGPIPWMIEAAAILSAVARDWPDFFIILSMLIINALVAFWQEHKADNAIALLKQKLATRARVLTLATVLGVISSFTIFWLAQSVWQLPEAQVQTLIFLELLVAGHMTLYLTRNDGHFWDNPWPSLKLFATTELTQVIGTLAAVYGWFVEPIGWGMAATVWACAFVWFLFNNLVKRFTLKYFRRYDARVRADGDPA